MNTKLIRFAIAVGVALIAEPSFAQYQPKYVSNSSAICLERPEEMGSSNIEPVTAIVDGVTELTLLGGYAACAYVPAGNHSIALRIQNEAGLQPNPTFQTTKPLVSFSNTAGSTTAFEICGAYTAWDVVPAGEAHHGSEGCSHQ